MSRNHFPSFVAGHDVAWKKHSEKYRKKRQSAICKEGQNDEFYTRFADIESECAHYKPHFQGKTVLCNCDDPRVSNFFRYYFFLNFHKLGLNRLIATCYKNLNPDLSSKHQDEQAVYCIYDGTVTDYRFKNIEEFVKQNEWGVLEGDGDFRSDECIKLLKTGRHCLHQSAVQFVSGIRGATDGIQQEIYHYR